jgi:hypothetical protein
VALFIAQPEYRLVSVSDGHTATQVWGSDAHPHITA